MPFVAAPSPEDPHPPTTAKFEQPISPQTPSLLPFDPNAQDDIGLESFPVEDWLTAVPIDPDPPRSSDELQVEDCSLDREIRDLELLRRVRLVPDAALDERSQAIELDLYHSQSQEVQPFLRKILDKFPSLPPYLAQRLATCNMNRNRKLQNLRDAADQSQGKGEAQVGQPLQDSFGKQEANATGNVSAAAFCSPLPMISLATPSDPAPTQQRAHHEIVGESPEKPDKLEELKAAIANGKQNGGVFSERFRELDALFQPKVMTSSRKQVVREIEERLVELESLVELNAMVMKIEKRELSNGGDDRTVRFAKYEAARSPKLSNCKHSRAIPLISPRTPSSVPPPPSDPCTPSSSIASFSPLSTIAIKDGRIGRFPRDSVVSAVTLEAERADRISRLRGLVRASTADEPAINPSLPARNPRPRSSSVCSFQSSANNSIRGYVEFDRGYQRPDFSRRGSSASGHYDIERPKPSLPPPPPAAPESKLRLCDICGQEVKISRKRDWQ